MFDHDLLDLPILDQLEQLVKLGPGVAHARPDFLAGLDDLVLLLGTVGEQSVVLTGQVALGLLLMAAHPAVSHAGYVVCVFVLLYQKSLYPLDVVHPVAAVVAQGLDWLELIVTIPFTESVNMHSQHVGSLADAYHPLAVHDPP